MPASDLPPKQKNPATKTETKKVAKTAKKTDVAKKSGEGFLKSTKSLRDPFNIVHPMNDKILLLFELDGNVEKPTKIIGFRCLLAAQS